ncbi:hypothetical protein K438DRAFT_2065546 [Mycena galopus ATCC 62051]|nr:hypothetical protein K438DRAFT_2065546 [Mycena galopus ATCC 62051]
MTAPFFVRFWNEPWTADTYWQLQSLLPKSINAKLCPYIIYADKSKLSSFGTQKVYPIIARLSNMVVGIRNGNEWGGGQIVGELPVVTDDTAESGKTGYVNFKHAVWHAAFFKLLESIAVQSKTGIWVKCGDGVERQLFPLVLILVADYEEAVKAGENLLKNLGLHKVNNVFWNVAYSDPHHAISFDWLHSHHSGLWGDHLFSLSQIKLHLLNCSDRQAAKLDQQFNKLPHWRNLNHFQTVTNISFNDGSKHEDIAKLMIYASHNILTDKLGLSLLACIQSYLELNIYAGLEIHTTKTITTGRQILQKFGWLLNEYWDACVGTEFEDKNWDFPKAHLHQHLFDDIECKGITKNFTTKISESVHGPVRAAYLRQTNFKNVQPQILCSLHRRMVDFINVFLPAHGHALPGGKRVVFVPDQEITPYQFLKVFFKSLDNWLDDADFLQCNPSFHNQERYDAALGKTMSGNIFVRLVYVFTCKLEEQVHPFALVQALDIGIGQRSAKDKALGLYRVRQQEMKKCEFISVHSIIRGALLAPDFAKKGDYLVVDILDADMYFQLLMRYPTNHCQG